MNITVKCCVCGQEIEKSMFAGDPLCGLECFRIHFWNKIIERKSDYIIIDGECYHNAGDKPNGKYLGFGGHRFWIEMNDGSRFTTNNLWHCGRVPDFCRDDLPDNAKFYNPQNKGGIGCSKTVLISHQ